MFKLCVLLLSVLALVGCAPSPSGPRHAPHGDSRELKTIVTDNYSSEAVESCDHEWKDRVLEIANALEERKHIIQRQSQKTGPTHKLVSFEAFKFRELPDSQTNGAGEWKTEVSGWEDIWGYYQEAKNTGNDKLWVSINTWARSLAIDDRDRLIYWTHPNLHKDMKPTIEKAHSLIIKCLDDKSCGEINELPLEIYNYLKTGFAYADNYAVFTKPYRSLEQRRKTLEYIRRWVAGDLRRYSFRKNDSGKYHDHRLEIEMNSDLGGAVEFINEVVGKYWANAESHVVIRNSTTANAFKALFHAMIGGRAYVEYDTKSMHIFDYGSTKTIAHEIGHVLGFPDAYYTTWNAKTCKYTVQYREGDLMSVGDRVLPEHWNSLKSQYSH